MKGPAPEIYLVAPDANNAIMRKLKGAALALGVPLKVVANSKQLPSVPEPNSILVMPEGMKIALSDNHEGSWNRIFLTSSESNYSLEGSSKLIFTIGEAAQINELKIVQSLFAFIGVKGNSEWYAAKFNGECNFFELPHRVTPWLKSFKIFSHDPISFIIKSMNAIASLTGPSPVKFDVSFDGHSLELSLTTSECASETQKIIADLMTCPTARLIIVRHEATALKITIQCDLSASEVSQIKIIENVPSETVEHSEEDREAS